MTALTREVRQRWSKVVRDAGDISEWELDERGVVN
jgi:hypothetical protein